MKLISLQLTSSHSKRDHKHISLTYGLLFMLVVLISAARPALSEETGEAKPKPQGKTYAPEAVKHYNRGLELYNSGFLNKAVEEYKLAIKADDRLEQGYSNLGLIYIAQKNYVKAQEAFDKALALKPNRVNSLNGLASVLFAQNQVQAAIEQWKKALFFDPLFAPAYFNMGRALESQKNDSEALTAYVRAVSVAPDSMADAYYHMGTILNKQKHPAQALALLEHAVLLSPESEFARDARKQILILKERFMKEGGGTTTELPGHTIAPDKQNITPKKETVSRATPKAGTDQMLTKEESSATPAQETTGDSSKESGRETAKTPENQETKAAAEASPSNGDTAASGNTTGNTLTSSDSPGSPGKETSKTAKKKRKPVFKHTTKPQNDEERGLTKSNQPEEMKMFIKSPSQDGDLQAKPE